MSADLRFRSVSFSLLVLDDEETLDRSLRMRVSDHGRVFGGVGRGRGFGVVELLRGPVGLGGVLGPATFLTTF